MSSDVLNPKDASRQRWASWGERNPHATRERRCHACTARRGEEHQEHCPSHRAAQRRGIDTVHKQRYRREAEKRRADQRLRRAAAKASGVPRSADEHLRRRYGITALDKQAMLDRQGGCCAICRKDLTAPKRSVVDHSHTTGRVRGVLCVRCNVSIGQLGDTPSAIGNVLLYLIQGEARRDARLPLHAHVPLGESRPKRATWVP